MPQKAQSLHTGSIITFIIHSMEGGTGVRPRVDVKVVHADIRMGRINFANKDWDGTVGQNEEV